MCYDIKANLEAQLKRAKRTNDEFAIKAIEEKLLPYADLPLNHASGFNHPKLLVYTNNSPNIPTVAAWGLVPHWTKDEEAKSKIWQKTLNARSETIFEKPAFKEAVKNKRCLIYLDGFYEHHFHNGKSFPHYVAHKNGEPMIVGGIWDEWQNPLDSSLLKTFSIVTTKGNQLMTEIHNSPKLKEARMPLILNEELADEWLNNNPEDIENVLNYQPIENLQAHPVKPIKGKLSKSNIPEASEPHYYPALEEIQGTLFD
ncbi:MAG: SOS response-associated peptidase [Crocinitomicaceae bacterium]